MKRALDFLAAAAALVVLAGPLTLIALAVWAQDRGSPFYCGRRVGKGGHSFAMLKFRSMAPDAWKSGIQSTAAGDLRITPLGRLLRRFKLDEAPQLWNVLRGEMSLVGPRPQVPSEVDLYTHQERRLLAVRPGLTDLASIVFADEAGILAGSADPDLLYNQIIRPWKSRLALAYLDHARGGLAGLVLDLRILLLTLLSTVSRKRALGGVARLLEDWKADPLVITVVIEAARRRQPPMAYPPPGSNEIVARHPRRAAHA